jgi:hypothetical protein
VPLASFLAPLLAVRDLLLAAKHLFVAAKKRGERRDRLPLGRHLPVTASKCGRRGLGAHHTHHAQDPRLSGADVVHGVPDGPVAMEWLAEQDAVASG